MLRQSPDGVLAGDRSPSARVRRAHGRSPVVGCGLARAAAARAAAAHPDTLLRKRPEARDRRAGAACPPRGGDHDHARDLGAAGPRAPGRRAPDLPAPPGAEPPLAAFARRQAALKRRSLTASTRARPEPQRPIADGKGEGRLSAALGPGSQRWIWQRRFLPGPPTRSLETRRPAARNARPLRSAMAIPQWVSGTRLYPLVPPLPVLLESVTSGPPPFRGKSECIPARVDDGKPDAVPVVTASTRRRPRRRPCRRRASAPGTSRPGCTRGASTPGRS